MTRASWIEQFKVKIKQACFFSTAVNFLCQSRRRTYQPFNTRLTASEANVKSGLVMTVESIAGIWRFRPINERVVDRNRRRMRDRIACRRT